MLGKNSATDSCGVWLTESIGGLRASLGQPSSNAPEPDSMTSRRMLQLAVQGDLEALIRLMAALEGSLEPGLATSQMHRPALNLKLGAVVADMEEQWQQDRLDYDQVLQGFWTIRRALELRIARAQLQDVMATPTRSNRGPVLFASVPGGEHILGALSVADHFVLNHWQVDTCLGTTKKVLLERVTTKPFQLIGLTVGTDAELEGLADLIIDIRTRVAPQSTPIILGGNVFVLPDKEYRWLGANYIAKTLDDAMHFALQSVHYNYSSNESSP
jgi:hypothetical protein